MLHTFKENFKKCLLFLKSCPADRVAIPTIALGLLLKNILLQMFISGSNSFEPHFGIEPALFFRGVFFSLITILLLLCPVLLFKKASGKIGYGLTVSLLMTTLLIVDGCYFRGFSEIPSITILSAAGTATDTGNADAASVFSLLSPYDLLYFVDYALLIVFALFRRFYKPEGWGLKEKLWAHKKRLPAFFGEKSLRFRALRFGALCLCCGVILLFLPALNALGALSDAYYTVYEPSHIKNTVFYFTPIGYHIANIVDTVEKQVESTRTEDPDDPSEEKEETPEERRQRELIEAFYKYNAPLADNEYAGIFKDKNVILIQVESLENGVIGQSVEGVEITPNLNKLISQNGSSLYFPNIYDQVKAGNSSDCDLMINTSLLPTGEVFFRNHNEKLLPSLPVLLRRKGYGTYYYNGSGPTSVWPYNTVYGNVFDYVTAPEDEDCNFHMIEALLPEEKVYRYSSDENTFNFVLEDLSKNKDKNESFFSQIILCSSHTPFRYDNLAKEENRNPIPAEYCLPTPSDRKLAASKTFHYFNGLHYVDAQIGIFLEKAEKEGLLEDTVVLIYGDHLGIHKYFPQDAESVAETYPDYAFINEGEYFSVPLIIHDPSGKTEGKTFDIPGGQSDIMPTLLYLLGAKQEEYAFAMGKVLVNTDKNYTLIANGTIIGDQPDEEVKEILEMMYKVSDYVVERDEFGDLVKDERAAAKERAEQAAKEEENADASPSPTEALQMEEERLLPSKNEDEIR